MKVRVIQPDLKLLNNFGAFIYPKVGDVVDIANAEPEIRIDNVEEVEEISKLTPKVEEQIPTKGLKLPDFEEDEPKVVKKEPKVAEKKVIVRKPSTRKKKK